jgi:hypothetical protein
MRKPGILPGVHCRDSAGETPTGPTRTMRVLQHLVLSGEQILHKIVTAFIGVARGAAEMMINSFAQSDRNNPRRKDFVSRFHSGIVVRRRRSMLATITDAAQEWDEPWVSE